MRLYAIGIGAAIIGIMYAVIKHLGAKVDELEYEAKVNDKLKVIRKDQEEFTTKALKNEKEIINTKLKVKLDTGSIRDELNGL